jgi:hypothetical protein
MARLRDTKPRRYPNRDEKRALKAAEVAVFAKQYARRRQKGVEPNDRSYDRELEEQLKKLDPIELDRILRDDQED